jgi:GH24 family phage-related lysozyme (muramidase)
MPIEYSWIQKNVLNIISDGVSSSGGENGEGSSPSKKDGSSSQDSSNIPLNVEDLTQFNRKVPKLTSGNTWEAEAANFIALKEGFTKKASWDVNHYRGGYGSDKVLKNGKLVEVTENTTFTKQEAVDTLREYSIYEYSEIIIKALGKSNWDKLNNHQKTAIVSLGYNVGKFYLTSREYGKKIVKAIKKGDYQEAAQGILDGPKTAGGEYLASLARRRKEEAQLFLYPANKSIY